MADARAPGYSSDRNWEPNLLELTLFVSDVDASAEFYRAFGISLFDNDGQRARHYVDGGIGDCVLQLFPAGEQMISRVQLGVRVTSIAAVAAGLDTLGVPYEIPGARRIRAMDPDGNRIHAAEAYTPNG